MKIPSPCYDDKTKTSCPRRCAECATTCKEWAEYVKKRDYNYANKDVNTVLDVYESIRSKRFRDKGNKRKRK